MDAVYIFGSGSLAANEEIRYSVRSLEQNLLDLENIYVVGEKPEMLPGVRHVPASDNYDRKWQNAYYKTRMAAELPEISKEFLLMNDDFFLIEPVLGAEFPFFALDKSNGGNCGMHSYHIHAPMRIVKEWYLNMPFDINAKGHWSPRTMYANFYSAKPKFCDDFILRAAEGCRDFDEQIEKWPCFSIGDSAMLYMLLRDWLVRKYPEPSRFEMEASA